MSVKKQSAFQSGRFVLYRDPDLFHAGKPCTFVCKVTGAGVGGYKLREISSGRRRTGVKPAFMRPMDPAEVMRDIDTAPLDADATDLVSAAAAWLKQNPEGGDR